MKPLIKYTGGKYDEYKYFSKYLPEKINNYYETFFGGGGTFFRLHEENRINGKSFINDLSTDLMNFYSQICNNDFKKQLNILSGVWNEVNKLGNTLNNLYGNLFFDIILGKREKNVLINNEFTKQVENLINDNTVLVNYNMHGFSLKDRIIGGFNDKINRFIKKDIKDCETDIALKCITTCVCQSFYFIVRDMYNDWLLGNSMDYSQSEMSSQWFFIREYCFGSMFRFGKDGKFNIPYGGYGYNKKCLQCKIDAICDESVQKLFYSVVASCKDFEDAFDCVYEDDDFMFLDPPYDGIFSEYDNNPFTREDHIRLKKCLDKIKCKWMLVISRTDFIADLYKDYNQIEYNKTYMYQARGKYDSKNSIHLIIKNY